MSVPRVCLVCGGRADCRYRSSDYCMACFGPLLDGRLRGSRAVSASLDAVSGRVSVERGAEGTAGRVSEETETCES